MPMIQRFANNPIVSQKDVKSSRPDFEVMCSFNAGATTFNGKTVLLVRVAERPKPEPGYAVTAVLDPDKPGEFKVLRFRRDDPDLDLFDPRVFSYKGVLYLTSISHLRMATSADGRTFKVADKPTLLPSEPHECYGIEDPRITFIDGYYYINYSAISAQMGVITCLARTRDFVSFEKLGIMFAPDNKDIAIFPEKIDGRYWCFHRPSVKQLGSVSMWLASSENLLDWGHHHFLIGPRKGMWDSERVGCGAQPIRTPEGWLQMYHASDERIRYCAGALLLDLKQPWKVLARSKDPILFAEAPYETHGLMPNVIFHNGLVDRGNGQIDLYYGAADELTCGATMDLQAVLNSLK